MEKNMSIQDVQPVQSGKTVKQLTNNRFLNLKEVRDPENNVGGYQFAERLGVDSVAFIGYMPSEGEFLVNKEYKPPISKFITGAFGGSIDKQQSPAEIVRDEVREEAGFEVEMSAIKYLGRVFVSTQMNQFCFLFIVILDKKEQKERKPENAVEAMATTKWVKDDAIYKMEEWKPMAIISLAKESGIL
jgi:8-oxo-dGTP pyrophosphatase MutT (NUDIX family)